jgi:metal binding Ada-like protein
MMNILLFSHTNRRALETVMALILLTSIFLSPHSLADSPKTYGDAEVEKIIKVYEDYAVNCDVNDWPEIIGSDIKVMIKGVEPPEIVLSGGKPNTFFKLQLKKFMQKAFDDAENIKLENIERAETFALKANIVLDEKKLADLLIEAGLARIKVPGDTTQKKPDKVEAETVGPVIKEQPKQNVKIKELLVASKNSKVYHRASCGSAKRITQDNLVSFSSKQQAEQSGRRPCKNCRP